MSRAFLEKNAVNGLLVSFFCDLRLHIKRGSLEIQSVLDTQAFYI